MDNLEILRLIAVEKGTTACPRTPPLQLSFSEVKLRTLATTLGFIWAEEEALLPIYETNHSQRHRYSHRKAGTKYLAPAW